MAMLRIYTPLGLDGFTLCHPESGDDYERINILIDGHRRTQTWESPQMCLIHKDRGKRLRRSDSPWLGAHALIFSVRAKDTLQPILADCGEFLPLACAEEPLFFFNPTRVIDALDETASKVHRFSSGRLMGINSYVFDAERVRGVDAFKIPNLRVSPTFLSDRVAEAWFTNELAGLEFRIAWQSA